MHKLLCERPRGMDGWGDSSRTYYRFRDKAVHTETFVETDDEGNKIYLTDEVEKKANRRKIPISRSEKILNDYLAPLKGWLIKQAGRPWNKVFSELSQMFPAGVHAEHIKGHVKGYVETNPIFKDGIPCHNLTYARSYLPVSQENLYVDPNDGLLKWGKGEPLGRGLRTIKKRRYKKPQNPNVIKLNSTAELHKVNGIWYQAQLIKQISRFDFISKRSWIEKVWRNKQLSKKELKKYSLKNDAPN